MPRTLTAVLCCCPRSQDGGDPWRIGFRDYTVHVGIIPNPVRASDFEERAEKEHRGNMWGNKRMARRLAACRDYRSPNRAGAS
jgi:hypothetical protein